MKVRKKRMGRPTKLAAPGVRVPLSLRVTAEVKSVLDDAATRSGRSQSQEAELALEASLGDRRRLPDVLDFVYGKEAAGLMLLMGELAIDLQEGMPRATGRSLSDAWLFGQLRAAIEDTLTKVAPPGEPRTPDWKATAAADFGEAWAQELLGTVGHVAARTVLRSVFETKRGAERENAIRARLPWVGTGHRGDKSPLGSVS
jgi:hypothetical protein